MATNTTTSTTTTNDTVNLLDLAAACIACTETASVAIQTIVKHKNTKTKADGSFVTDADFAAQGVIVQAVRSVHPNIRIVGEESAEEMAEHIGQHVVLHQSVYQRTSYEVRLRYHSHANNNNQQQQQQQAVEINEPLPLAHGIPSRTQAETDDADADADVTDFDEALQQLISKLEDLKTKDPDDCHVDVTRVSVVVDPLDGTKSYANGEYDSVSILIAILVDHQPTFGVIGKPFGYTGLQTMLDTTCVAIYGGPLLKGVYIAGNSKPVQAKLPLEQLNEESTNQESLPRAVISSSRSEGVVHDFCLHLAKQGYIHPDPMFISGAGEKSLRILLQRHQEALWFFPKGGTSRWDVAAPDALFRSLGGKLTDKYGNSMDYSTTRTKSENLEGVVACIDATLHQRCIELFQQGDWINQR